MYLISAGCSSLLHLAIQFPVLVGAFTLAGFVTQVQSNPGPGDRHGTASSLARLEHKLVTEHPELAAQAVQLRVDFNRLNTEPTEDQIRQVLKQTDSCTDVNAQSLNPDQRREAAWILYLDTVSRQGRQKADLIFVPQKE